MNKIRLLPFLFFLCIYSITYSQDFVEGTVYYEDSLGNKVPLSGVSVFWENTSLGTLSDDNGNYKLTISDSSKRLLFKYLGFRDQIIQFNNQSSIITMIEEENVLDEVVVNKKQKTIQKSYFKTQNITNVSSEELLKAACCNISESFETNPSIELITLTL